MAKAKFFIDGRPIGDDSPVFIIAEAGANHNGNLDIAKKLADEALNAGADCIKFQTFSAEEFCLDKTKTFTYMSQGKSVTESEFEMFKRLEFTECQWKELMEYCKNIGILFLTTIQDPINLKMMKKLDLKGIKVGSDDFDHTINLKTFAKSQLPLILSKGMSDFSEVDKVLKQIMPIAKNGLAVLHCVSLYPSEASQINLKQIVSLKSLFPDVVWGFSDHTFSTVIPSLAVSYGAKIIEKHFTLDHNLPGPDHWFSMDPSQMQELVENIRIAEKAEGDGVIRAHNDEKRAKKIMRRRVIAKTSLPVGSKLTENVVSFKRADTGAFAGEWDFLEGKKLKVAKRANQTISVDDI